jgi:hypothetical protein
MATATGITWIVGTTTEVGALEERLGPADATIRETWPGQVGAGIVALVEAGPDAGEQVRDAFGPDAAPFDDEDQARTAAAALARRQ